MSALRKQRPDGGRTAAQGFQYQYLRTLEVVLENLDDNIIESCRIEGGAKPNQLGGAEVVDFELLNAAGHAHLVAQVKSTSSKGTLGSSEALAVLIRLVKTGAASKYQLLTNRRGTPSLSRLQALLPAKHSDMATLRSALAAEMSAATTRQAELAELTDSELERLATAEVVCDRRDVEGVRRDIRAHLDKRRRQSRLGIGPQSSGLVTGHLISEVLRRAASDSWGLWRFSDVRRITELGDRQLIDELGSADWGVLVGNPPPLPEVRRENVADELQNVFEDKWANATATRVVLLTGLSGVGKSSVAAGYIGDELDRYDVVYWVDASSQMSLASHYSLIADTLTAGHSLQSPDINTIRAEVLNQLKARDHRWLLVLDDATDLRDLQQWLPRLGRGDVLITSTDSATTFQLAARLEIGPLSSGDAASLLARRLSVDLEVQPHLRQHLSQLASYLENWPLALALAAGFISSCGLPIDQLEDFQELLRARTVLSTTAPPVGYPRTMPAILDLCLERIEYEVASWPQLREVTDVAIAVLAYLAPRQVPLQVLLGPSTDIQALDPAWRGAVVADPQQFPVLELLQALRSVSLVQLDEPLRIAEDVSPTVGLTVAVNSIVQDLLRARLDQRSETKELLVKCCWHVERWLSSSYLLGHDKRTISLLPHAQALVQHTQRLGVTGEAVALLLGNLAAVELGRGQHQIGQDLLEAEVSLLERLKDRNPFLELQAKLSLATAVLSHVTTEDTNLARSLFYLEEGLPHLMQAAQSTPGQRAYAADLVARVRHATSQVLDAHVSSPRLMRIRDAYASLANKLPSTTLSRAIETLREASESLDSEKSVAFPNECYALAMNKELPADVRGLAQCLTVEAAGLNGDWQAVSSGLSSLLVDSSDRADDLLVPNYTKNMLSNLGLAAASAALIAGDRSAHKALQLMVASGTFKYLARDPSEPDGGHFRTLRDVASIYVTGAWSYAPLIDQAELEQIQDMPRQAREKLVWSILRSLVLAAPTILDASSNRLHGKSGGRQQRGHRRAKLRGVDLHQLLDHGIPLSGVIRIRLATQDDAVALDSFLRTAGPQDGRFFSESLAAGELGQAIRAGLSEGKDAFQEVVAKAAYIDLRALVQCTSIVLVALEGDAVVGAAMLGPPYRAIDAARKFVGGRQKQLETALSGTICLVKVTQCVVAPGARNQGIGSGLIGIAQRVFARCGYLALFGVATALTPGGRFSAPPETRMLNVDEPYNAWVAFGFGAAIKAPPGGRMYVDEHLKRLS